MRALSGTGWGAVYGVAGGILANLMLAVGSSIATLLADPGDVGQAFGIGVLFLFFGTIVATAAGAIVGAICGLIIGAARAERHAPVIATIVSAGLPLAVFSGDSVAGSSSGLDATQALLLVLAIIGFGVAGYVVGVGFRRKSPWGWSGSDRPSRPLPVVQAGEQKDDPAVGWLRM